MLFRSGSTILIPTLASEIGLAPAGQTSFEWTVQSFALIDAYTGEMTDLMGTGIGSGVAPATYDAFDPVVSNGAFRKVKAGDSVTLDLSADYGRLEDAVDSNKGWMVVALDDMAGPAQADLVPIGELTVVPG